MDRKPLYTHLYFQVLTGIAVGVVLGHFWPGTGAAMRPLGDGFIKLIRMLIAPKLIVSPNGASGPGASVLDAIGSLQ